VIVFATRYTSLKAPGDADGSHVADDHRDRISAGLGEQLPGHVRGQLDAVHGDPPLAQRERHSPCPDRELESRPAPGQFGEQIDDGAQNRRLELGRVGRVVDVGYLRAPGD
jgi:hypothetical protein